MAKIITANTLLSKHVTRRITSCSLTRPSRRPGTAGCAGTSRSTCSTGVPSAVAGRMRCRAARLHEARQGREGDARTGYPRDRRYYTRQGRAVPDAAIRDVLRGFAKDWLLRETRAARGGRLRSGSPRFAAIGTRASPKYAASCGRRCRTPRSCCLASTPRLMPKHAAEAVRRGLRRLQDARPDDEPAPSTSTATSRRPSSRCS